MLSILFLYTALKHLPLVVVALTQNMAPLFTVLFSCMFFRIRIACFDVGILMVTFGGVVLMLSGIVDNSERENPTQDLVSLIVPIVCLILMPILMAGNILLLRQLRKVNELTIATYMSLSMILFYTPIVYLSGQSLSFVYSLSYEDWVMVFIISVASVFI